MKSTDNVIEELRAEIAKLREEITALRLQGGNHYHYHQTQPFLQPRPVYYPGYAPAYCGGVAGQAIGIGQGGGLC